ncbi:conserved Plasmodium protein, unknown function [Plasmodium ovale wallikeri]|uniref:Uncharacterized protein n=1 Tax=Plasmodium ovale wallikeri TaxID=864142 RepID=A0A1A8Z855_PLAOA|nr:conserved Plasmodium protein, unknown function [Plasmodium ovale wallikeri]
MDVFSTEKILDQMKDYNLISLNTSGECDEEDRLLKIRKEITPREAAEECNRIPTCKFILFDYNKKLGDEETTVDKSILCSRKNNVEVPNLMKKKKDAKKKITNSTVTAVGGSITPDGNYHNYKKGEVVHVHGVNR